MNAEEENELDFYTLLNVDKTASYEEIQRGYKTLSRTFHPDRLRDLQDKQDAQDSFVLIKQAHDVLSDSVLRFAYDFAGLIGVAIVKRSQQQQQQQQQQSQHEDDDSIGQDLYAALQQASKEGAVLILQETMEQYHQQKSEASPHFDASLELPFRLYDHSQLERDSASVHFHCRSQPTPHVTATIGASSQVQRTAETDIHLSSSVSYQAAPGSQIQVDAAMNHQQSSPNLSFRTQRQLASGTVMSVIVGGNVLDSKTWMYSLISYRTLLWNNNYNSRRNDDKEPTKLQAFWRINVAPTGQVRFAMASIKRVKFPQWRVRLSSSILPLKVSYQPTRQGLYVAWSTAGFWTRIKATMACTLGRWKIRYGLKYDGSAIHTGGLPWSVVCKLHSSDWTLRVPISLTQPTDWPVGWLLSIMISQWLDQELTKWTSSLNQDRAVAAVKTESSSTMLSHPAPFADMVSRIAAKKRTLESEQDGLVILKAMWQDHDRLDVTDILQYWVVDGNLHLPVHETRWWRATEHTQEPVWTWAWYKLLNRYRPPKSSSADAGALNVRYQSNHRVYEIEFEGDELVWLPNARARELGKANLVS